VFPWIPRLGGVLECRSNWQVYAEEFALALGEVTGRPVGWAPFTAEVPLTPFERKYRDSGQALYRLELDLGLGCGTPPGA
jgi:tRNA (guanine-N7-)-methyltransferase